MHKNQTVFSFVKEATKPFRIYINILLFIAVFCAIENSLFPFLTKLLIDKVANTQNLENIFSENIGIVSAFIALIFAPGLLWRLADYSFIQMEPGLKKNISINAITILHQQSQNFFQNNFAGSLTNKIKDLASSTPTIINVFIFNFVTVFFILIFAFITLFSIHKYFALALIFWSSLFILVSIKYAKMAVKYSSDLANHSTKITGNIVDMIGNINNVKFFVRQDFEKKRLANLQDNYTKLYQERGWLVLKFYIIAAISFALYFSFCVLTLMKLYAINQVTLGDFAMLITINCFIIHNMWQMANEMRHFLELYGTIKQALSIINEPIEIEDKETSQSLVLSSSSRGEIVFQNVNFSYKPKTPSAKIEIADWNFIGESQKNLLRNIEEESQNVFFKNLSITIKSGQKIGLVGHSGSGKSTFVNLILRSFDIESGKILIDNQDISAITQDSLRSAVALIPQDPTLFHRSLFENIGYAKINASEPEIIDAAKKAHADEFIQNMPQKYGALVGERGVKLSGGQRQRIAIARAFLKNAPILILDEATSQLDSITENLIQDSLKNLMQNKTVLIIAHRLSTLADVDRILVFSNGKIVEDGSHQELLALNGHYKKLWNAQIGGFLME